MVRPMQRRGTIALTLPLWLALLALAACSSSSLPVLPSATHEPASNSDKTEAHAPLETAVMVAGTPTEVYTLVARGAMACWFGASGALKVTHVFQAEAESPTDGGAAEIVLHERDETLRDKRGSRAFRVSFLAQPAGVRVQISILKLEPQLAKLMTKDTEAWAKGSTSCEVRRPEPAQQPSTPIAGKTPASAPAKKR